MKPLDLLEEELNGSQHKYGYKQLYAVCNKEYAALISEKQRYIQALKEAKSILREAITSLNNGEKVNGLEWAVSKIEQTLEDNPNE